MRPDFLERFNVLVREVGRFAVKDRQEDVVGVDPRIARHIARNFRRMMPPFRLGILRRARCILGCQYHAVVGNPPYIAPKDPAMRAAYREIYESCYRGYGLGAPFIERSFDLAIQVTQHGEPATSD